MRGTLYTVSVFVVIVLLAAVLDGAQLLRTNMLGQEAVSLDGYMDGTVSRPFAYRVLLPQLLRGINAITPAPAAAELDRLGGKIGWTGPQQKYGRDVVWLALIQFASLIGYAIAGSLFYATLRGSDRSKSDWIVGPVLLLMLAPIVYRGLGHIYDFTGLFLAVSLLLAMAAGRHAVYLALFALGCLNKETTLLMSVAYASVFFRRLSFGRYAAMLVAQSAIFLAIYLPIRTAYKDNPGSGIQVHWQDQLPYYFSHLQNGFVLAAFLTAVIVLLFLAVYRWGEKPQLLRRASVMTVPHMALFIYGAAPGEVRNLYEIVPVVSMLMLFSVSSIRGSFHDRVSAVN